MVEAPQEPVIRVVEAPTAKVEPAAPIVRSVEAPAPIAAPDAPAALTRTELAASLADFGKLAGSIRAEFTPAGLRIDAVAERSLFAKAGLRAGDVVTAVDNQPLRSLDDAATLYARAGTARNVSIQALRGGKPVSLRVAIQ